MRRVKEVATVRPKQICKPLLVGQPVPDVVLDEIESLPSPEIENANSQPFLNCSGDVGTLHTQERDASGLRNSTSQRNHSDEAAHNNDKYSDNLDDSDNFFPLMQPPHNRSSSETVLDATPDEPQFVSR